MFTHSPLQQIYHYNQPVPLAHPWRSCSIRISCVVNFCASYTSIPSYMQWFYIVFIYLISLLLCASCEGTELCKNRQNSKGSQRDSLIHATDHPAVRGCPGGKPALGRKICDATGGLRCHRRPRGTVCILHFGLHVAIYSLSI